MIRESAIIVSERRRLPGGRWVRGRLRADPTVVVEASDERYSLRPRTVPGSDLTYVGMWRGPRTLLEFQLGTLWPRRPHDDAIILLSTLLSSSR